ncbi:MAG: adenosylcobinamide-GDP ribazoletransferase [Candidatus Omnitrophota bacterium]
MTGFLLAVQFLTILPLKIKNFKEKDLGSALVFFPLVGLIIGIILSGINSLLLSLHFDALVSSCMLVVSLTILTGGLHLDGLSDTADAFFSRKAREEQLAIMRDSRIGTMGVLAVICIILLKIAFIYSVNSGTRPLLLALMCVLSRWSMLFSMYFFPYARKEGKAKGFIEQMNLKNFILATLVTLIMVFLYWKTKGLFVFIFVSLLAYLISLYSKHKVAGITGDTLGALNELIEVAVLIFICVSERMQYV